MDDGGPDGGREPSAASDPFWTLREGLERALTEYERARATERRQAATRHRTDG